MKTFLIFISGAVVGGIACVLLASIWFTGIGAGVGVATGLKAGACLTIEAAKEQGLITAEQAKQVLHAAGRQILSTRAGDAVTPSGADLDCEKVVAELKAAAKQAD